MDSNENNRLRAYYHTLADEELLDFYKNQAHEFLPEALDLIRNELSNRGFRLEDLEPEQPKMEETEKQTIKSKLVPVADCDEYLIATQAKDILEQQGIAAYVDDRQFDHHAFHGLKTPVSKTFKVMVFEKDVSKSKEILSTFPPLQDQS